jgi:hypothetical protein
MHLYGRDRQSWRTTTSQKPLKVRLAAALTVFVIGAVIVIGGCYRSGTSNLELTASEDLRQFQDRVRRAIEHSDTQPTADLLEAGNDAYFAVVDCQKIVAKRLNLPTDTVGADVRQQLHMLESITQNIERHDFQAAQQTAAMMINQLSRSSAPRLTAITPHFVAYHANGRFRLLAKGTFASDQPFSRTPSLESSATASPLSATALSPTDISFDVPYAWLQRPERRIILNAFTLDLPPYSREVRKDEAGERYRLLIASVPGSPGTIRFRTSLVPTSELKRHIVGSTKRVDSATDDHDFDVVADSIPAGWAVVPSSVGTVVTSAKGRPNGDWWLDNLRHSPIPTIHVRTEHRRLGASGQLEFHFVYDIVRSDAPEQWDEKVITLDWDRSISLRHGPRGYTLAFDALDGTHYEAAGSMANKYIAIKDTASTVTVTTPAVDKVRW